MSKYIKPKLKPWCVAPPAAEVGRAAPAKSISYRVKDGDNWMNLAAAWGVDVWSLINFNFRTYDPKVVNWYLQEYVGCVLPTADRKNWCFSGAASPGIIYRPLEKAGPVKGDPVHYPPMPGPSPVDDSWKPPGSGNWFGIGVKGGGHIVVGGADTATIFAISLDDPRDYALLQVTMGRIGPGLGASASLVVAGIGNCYDPRNLRGWPLSGFDFQLAAGAKWGSLMKIASKAGPLLDAVKGGKNAKSLLNAGFFHAGKRDEIINAVKNGMGALGLFPREGDPDLSVEVVDLPLGGGAEASAYYGWGGVQVLSMHMVD